MGMGMAEISNEVYLRVDQEGGPPLKKSGVHDINKAFFDVMLQALNAGEDVSIPKFGKFKVIERAERNGRNPKTGESMRISARKAVRFRPSNTLRMTIAGIDPEAKKEKPAKAEGKKNSAKDKAVAREKGKKISKK